MLLCLALPATRAHAAAAPDSLAFPPPRVRAWQLGLARPDRLQHASLSFALAAGTGIATRDRAAAFGATLCVGVLKEVWDSRRDRFDVVDLTADLAGATLGALAAGRR